MQSSKSQRRNFSDEFNKSIQFIESVINEFETFCSTSNYGANSQCPNYLNQLNKLTKAVWSLEIMLDNEYFQFMYTNNFIIKEFFLKFTQLIIRKLNTESASWKLKSEIFKILSDLVEWDFNLEKNQFRNETSKQIYGQFFSEIVNELTDSLYALNKVQRPSMDTKMAPSNTTLFRPLHNSIFSAEVKPEENLINLNKLICYLFSSVPLQYLIHVKFIPGNFDLIFNQLLSPILYSQLVYTISNNICGFTHSNIKDLNTYQISEDLRLRIHEKCSGQTLYQMERNVRIEGSRNLLKKALNNYCQYITSHKKSLESLLINQELLKDCSTNLSEINDIDERIDDEQFQILNHLNEWQEALYKIVINIVKILRLEFENNTNHVEIDLVIYFYELLLTNIDSLTTDDSINIANKLMPVLIKINSWRERENGNAIKKFKPEQSLILYNLSFKLADKFMLTLGKDFCLEHWENFEPIWLEAMGDWYPMSFKMISTFCENMMSLDLFQSTKKLAQVARKSWDDNYNLPKNGSDCFCKEKRSKKNYISFLSEQSMKAIIDLAHFYDWMIQTDLNYYQDFMHDIVPLLEILRNLLNITNNNKKLVLFNQFYQELFQLKSPILRTVEIWQDHLVSIMLRMERMLQNSNGIDLEEKVYETTLGCLKSVTQFFEKSYLMQYRATINDTLFYINTNSNVNYPLYDELIEYFKSPTKSVQ